MTLDFEDERIQYHYGMEADLMLKFFFKGLCSKPACHQCVFKSIERVSDFTILIVGMLNFTIKSWIKQALLMFLFILKRI